MTTWEVVKTIFGHYRNDFTRNGWEESPGIWIPKEKYRLDQDVRETDEIIGENNGLTRDEIEENEKIESTKVEEKDIFEDIIGHDHLKTIFKTALTSDENVHILLTGAPGSAKSLFLEAIADNVRRTHFINNNSTGAGMILYLAEHPELKYLLIDEIEKIKKDELAVLLTLMESGRLTVEKKTMRVNRKHKLTIIATCNNVERLAPEMRSRFLKFTLKPYNYMEFQLVARNIVTRKFKRTSEYAQKVGKVVWEGMNSRDIRDVLKITKLCKDINQIETIAKALAYYSEDNAKYDIE